MRREIEEINGEISPHHQAQIIRDFFRSAAKTWAVSNLQDLKDLTGCDQMDWHIEDEWTSLVNIYSGDAVRISTSELIRAAQRYYQDQYVQ